MSALAITQDDFSSFPAEETLVPPPPETIEDTGLSRSLIEHLIFKLLYFRGDILGRDLAAAIGLKFSLIDDLVETLKRQHLLQVKRSLGLGNTSALFALTDEGRTVVRECLESNQYSGPAPVPLFQYAYFVRQQKRRDGWLTPKDLATAYSRMVVTDKLLSQIGPAVSSGNSFLIYGQPGNGKTFLAEALQQVDASEIYVPYAIESQGNIVQVYDPNYHHAVKEDETPSAFTFQPQNDGRWIKCRRPFIVTGGELTLEMLDLNYNKSSKVYDAPYQLKSNNGIYLIDDFGRQKCTPAEVMNRWIVPMERRMDYLTFLSGGKMTVPFETFLIFSTNLKPDQLGDEAFLRRIQYKMLLRSPDETEFVQIFRRFCESKKLPYPDDLPNKFVARHYHATGKKFRRCHPRDVISHAIDLIHFEKLPFRLTDDVLLRAFESCFTEEVE
jgi:DNA-binding MarR family transcriptional regulator